jgi:photosystem II stability/assembly factor-like uncharacterized protein
MPDRDDHLSADLEQYYRQLAQQPAPDVAGRVMMLADDRSARRRRFLALGGGLLAAGAIAAVVVLALANHSAPTGVAPAQSPTAVATASPTPSASPAPPTAPVVAGPALQGFVPADVTAVSAAEWWVLGSNGSGCSSAGCTRIAHTTDGGRTFSSIPVPALSSGLGGTAPARLRFADPADGWLVSGAGELWSTHDGGAHWARPATSAPVSALEAFGGSVYAVVCNGGGCFLERSPTGQDSWSPLPASAGHGELAAAIAVNGSHLWVAVASPGGGPGSLLASADGGQSFSTQTVCPSALGFARVSAAGAGVLWATCATGTSAAVYRSVDGGGRFTAVPQPSPAISNASRPAAVSSNTALVDGGSLLRTSDAGKTYTVVADSGSRWSLVGFTTPVDGFALAVHGTATSLWRSDDGGATWHQVMFP